MAQQEYSIVDAADVDSFSDEADVLVVGLGASGTCAAIEAREAGADVLVLERASAGGGLTMSAAGHFYLGGGTRVQKAVGVKDDVEEMIKYLEAVTPEPDMDKIRVYCEQSVEHFDWLVARGVPFKDTMYPAKDVVQMTDECLIWSGNEEAWPFREKAIPAPRGHKVAKEGEAGGAELMDRLIPCAERLGVRLECDAGVEALVRASSGEIVGVRYRKFDELRTVRARKAVILATGHYTLDPEMLAANCPRLADDRIEKQGSTFDFGVGHKLGVMAGGVTQHMDGALITSPFYPPECLLKGILVNKHGKRFIDEDCYHARSSAMCLEQPDGKAYLIADESFFERPAYGWQELIDAWDTIEDMERDLKMPEGALQKTIADYNQHAKSGEDPEYHKAAKWLVPLATPPYAALDLSLGSAHFVGFALGGLKCSIDGEVLDPQDKVIPGLYAIGACASNIAQDGKGYSSGTCIGESTFFGRRAGRHAGAPD